jgi:hypothetical protein
MSEEGWEARMAAKAAERQAEHHAKQDGNQRRLPDRSTWPVPEHLKGYSGRDVFLWYAMDGWRRILGGEPKVLFDHDLGYHVISDGIWQLELAHLHDFPDKRFPEP